MIDLLPDESQQALADSFAEVLRAEAPISRLHGPDHDGDEALVRQLAGLGWIGLGIPEDRGGLGLGTAEMALLMREAGRQLVGPRLLATMLAAESVRPGVEDQLLDGRRQAALAFRTPQGGYRLDHQPGDPTLIMDGYSAVVIEAEIAGENVRVIDDTVRLERVDLSAGLPSQTDAGRRAVVLVAAILVGMAEAARDMASSYAKVREQFGQPIGAFQAIKHRCADMALACEAAWSQTVFAALALDGARPDARFQAAAARLIAGKAALEAARANIQVHGGIGFTEEFDAQLFVRRTHIWLEASGGTRRYQAVLLAEPAPAA